MPVKGAYILSEERRKDWIILMLSAHICEHTKCMENHSKRTGVYIFFFYCELHEFVTYTEVYTVSRYIGSIMKSYVRDTMAVYS